MGFRRKSLSENGARLCRRPAAARRDLPNDSKTRGLLRVILRTHPRSGILRQAAMSGVKLGEALGLFVFSLLKAVSVFLPFRRGSEFKTFSWRGQRTGPLLFLLSVRGPAGTAPGDTCGHSQETSAPNLSIGSLPIPPVVRARAVSNCLGLPAKFKVSVADL